MKYFHAVSVYQLINMLLYKKKFCDNEESCLILRNILVPKIQNMEYINSTFGSILIYQDYWRGKTEEEQESCIKAYFDELFQKQDLNIHNAETIVVGCAHNTFGMYLSMEGIPFFFLEDAAGLMSRHYILEEINQKQYTLKYQLICKYGLITGNNPNIQKYICDFQAQDECFTITPDLQYMDFCVVQELSALSESERKKIIEVFTDIQEIPIKENTLVLLTQHFANLRSLSFEEQILIYQLFIDYFTEGYNVIIKPHPDDLMYYPLLFPEIPIIKEKFPAEFLPFMFTEKPRAVATISSTSSFSLRGGFENIIEMGIGFEKDFVHIHKYYVVFRLYKYLFRNKKVVLVGCNRKMFMQLAGDEKDKMDVRMYEVGKRYRECLIVVDLCENISDDFLHESLCSNDLVFINSDQSFAFYDCKDKGIWKFIMPILITQKAVLKESSRCVSDTESEVIYVATKKEGIKEMLKKFEIKKELKSSEIVVEVKPLSEEEEKIKVLEGILRATEIRLKKYLDSDGGR